MRAFLTAWLSMLAFCLTTVPASASLFTPEEVKWLNSQDEFIVGVTGGWPPFSYKTDRGVIRGFDIEMIGKMNVHLGGRLKVKIAPWSELLEGLDEGEVDVLMNMRRTDERRKKYDFSKAYTAFPYNIVARDDGPDYMSLEALEGRTIAVERGFFMESYLHKNVPGVKTMLFDTTEAALRGVQNFSADAYIGNGAASDYFISEYAMTDLSPHGSLLGIMSSNAIAVSKTKKPLAIMVDKILDTISHREKQEALLHWQRSTDSEQVFTSREITWMQENPVIRVGAEEDWPPFDFVQNGKAVGYSNDYMRLLAKKIGMKVEFIHGFSWNSLMAMLKNKDVDVLPACGITEERKLFALFSEPYYSNKTGIFVHRDRGDVQSMEDLRNDRIAVVHGYSTISQLKKWHPEVLLDYYNSPLEAMLAVSEGRSAAYLDYMSIGNYIRQQQLIPDLRVAGIAQFLSPEEDNLYLMLHNDSEVLTGILRKAQKMVAHDELYNLHKRWMVQDLAVPGKPLLSPTEKEWIQSLGPLRLGVGGGWRPYVFLDEKNGHSGVFSEYVKLLKERVGLEVEIVPIEWNNLMRELKNGNIDMLAGAVQTEERRPYLAFSRPFLSVPEAIITRHDSYFVTSVENLVGRKVGIGAGFASQQRISAEYPDLDIVGYSEMTDMLDDLLEGGLDAVIMSVPIFDYYSNHLKLRKKLKINTLTPYASDFSIGVRHEYAPLVSIVNRTLSGISDSEHQLIMDKWTGVEVFEAVNWTVVLYVSAAGTLIIFLIMFWNKRLNDEVQKRTQSEMRLTHVVDSMADWTWEIDKEGKYLFCTSNIVDTLGYSSEEVIGECIFDFTAADTEKETIKGAYDLIAAGEVVEDVETWHYTKDGQRVCLLTSGVPAYDEGNCLIGYRGVTRDVTEKKLNEKVIQFGVHLSENLEDYTPDAIYSLCVDKAMEITSSEYGFLALVNEAEDKIDFVSIGAKGLADNKIDMNLIPKHISVSQGLWAGVVRSHESYLNNDYAKRFAGESRHPAGHIPLNRLVMVPIMDHGDVAALIGVGNKVALYDQQDLLMIKTLAHYAWTVIKRKQSDMLLRDRELQYRSIFNDSSDAIALIHVDEGFKGANPAALSMFGVDEEALSTMAPASLSPEVQPDGIPSISKAREVMQEALDRGMNEFEWLHKRANGEEFHANVRLSAMPSKGVGMLQATIRDITAQKKLEEELTRLSNVDALTNIANRRYFDSVFEKEWRRGRRNKEPLALLMVDIDFFKDYNDLYGHQGGDHVLRAVGSSLKSVVNRPSDLPARYGGEEFSIILPETDKGGGLLIAERLRREIELLKIDHERSSVSKYVTVSIGVSAIVPDEGISSDVLIKEADKALYESKRQGRNKVTLN